MAPGPQNPTTEDPLRAPLPLRAFFALTVFSALGTLASHLTGLDPGPIRPVAAFLTLAAGCAAVAVLAARLLGPAKAAAGLLALLLVGAAAEIVGLYTAFPFGPYEYTGRWAPSLPLPGDKTFPVLLPFAWVMIVGASVLATWPFFRSWAALPAGAALAALVDLVMEPVMVGPLAYWRWLSPPTFFEAPWVNSFGWVLTGSLGSAHLVRNLLEAGPGKAQSKAAAHFAALVLFLHLALMLFLAYTHRPVHPSTPALAFAFTAVLLLARKLRSPARQAPPDHPGARPDADKPHETSVEVRG